MRARAAAILMAFPGLALAQAAPSFDCKQKLTSSVEERICNDAKLAALDRKLAQAYGAALYQATDADKQALTAEQRSWVKARNDCWKVSDVPGCVETAYHERIADLTALYRLSEPVGIGHYLCPGPPAQELVAAFYDTDPPTAMVDYAGTTQLMRIARSGSGARYTGGQRQFWEHQDVATLQWSPKGPEVSCPKK